MSGDADVLRQALAWDAAGEPVALATVVSTWGSAPRRPGSHLAVNAHGEFVGSVSGGCVEAAVIEVACEVLGGAPARRVRYGVTDAQAWEVGLACGGTIEVLVQPLARGGGIFAGVAGELAARRSVVLGIDLATGDVEVVGGGAAAEAVRRDRSGVVEGAPRETFVRVYAPPVRVVVIGAVHVAQALAPMVRLAGYEPVVVDPRPPFATPERFADVRLVGAWPDEALAQIGLDARTAVVALTHDPKLDDPALAAALRSDAFYVGALGSRKTHAARRERLREVGFSDAELGRIHAPVGLDLGAVSPGEIATAILAEVVACLRNPAPASSRDAATRR